MRRKGEIETRKKKCGEKGPVLVLSLYGGMREPECDFPSQCEPERERGRSSFSPQGKKIVQFDIETEGIVLSFFRQGGRRSKMGFEPQKKGKELVISSGRSGFFYTRQLEGSLRFGREGDRILFRSFLAFQKWKMIQLFFPIRRTEKGESQANPSGQKKKKKRQA